MKNQTPSTHLEETFARLFKLKPNLKEAYKKSLKKHKPKNI